MNPDRIAKLLATGMNATSVASVVGCSPAYISQLKTDTSFLDSVAAYAAEVGKKDMEEVALSSKYLEAEHALLNRVAELTPMSEMRDTIAALRVVAERQVAMKKTVNPNLGTMVTNNAILVLPIQMIAAQRPTVTITDRQEVIAVGEQNLAPLSSTAVTNLFAAMNKAKLTPISSMTGDKNDSNREAEEPSRSYKEALSTDPTSQPSYSSFWNNEILDISNSNSIVNNV